MLADLDEGLPGVLDDNAQTLRTHHQMLREGHALLSLKVRDRQEDHHHGDAVLDLFPEVQLDDDAAAVRLGPNEARLNEVVLVSHRVQGNPPSSDPLSSSA